VQPSSRRRLRRRCCGREGSLWRKGMGGRSTRVTKCRRRRVVEAGVWIVDALAPPSIRTVVAGVVADGGVVSGRRRRRGSRGRIQGQCDTDLAMARSAPGASPFRSTETKIISKSLNRMQAGRVPAMNWRRVRACYLGNVMDVKSTFRARCALSLFDPLTWLMS